MSEFKVNDASYLDFETLSVLSGTSRSRTKELVYKKGFKNPNESN